MLSSIAADAARSDRTSVDTRLLLSGVLALPLVGLPLSLLLFVIGRRPHGSFSDASLLVLATTGAALLFFTANTIASCARSSGASAALQRGGVSRLALALLGLCCGVVVSSRVSSEVAALNALAAAAVLVVALVALLCFMNAGLDRWQRPLAVAVIVLAAGKCTTFVYSQFDDVYERLTTSDETEKGERFLLVLQNRRGVVTITTSGWLHENGRVQGIFNTNPVPALDLNRCSRAFVIPAVVKEPRAILLIGLGSGSWAQILANHPQVKTLVILEDNPAYEKAIRNSGVVASLLQNQRVKLVSGATESSLSRQGKFDVIIHDRLPFRKGRTSPLLTKEFFHRLKGHLNRGGAVYVNAMGNAQIERTLLDVFPFLLRYQDMIFGTEERLQVDGYKWMRELMSWEIDGQRVLSTRKQPTEVARHVVQNRQFRGGFAWEREDSIRERTKSLAPLTADDARTPWWHFETLP
jgi:spermidine synthase